MRDKDSGISELYVLVQLEDQENPRLWSMGRKWICTSILLLMTAMIAFCSSIYTPAIPSITLEYGCSSTVATLGITTFLLGFGSGPLLFAPLSEGWSRNAIFRAVLGLFVQFQIGCALAPNVASMIVFRFLAGFFGSPAVTNSGGSITDIWPQDNRSVPLALFSAASFLGPNFWLVLIVSGTCYVAMIMFLLERYAEKLLLEETETARAHSCRRARETRGWSPGNASLSFLGTCVGMALATLMSPYLNRIQRIHTRRLGGPYPEIRLPHLIVIAWLIPISLFWFGWTAAPPTHWISGILAGVPFGIGLICFPRAVLRSIFGAVFPLFATDMYQSLGIPWATSVLAFVSLAMAPLPCKYHLQTREFDG
ncbi:major facilitator superfamily domain-containing protein [Aspergillus undulatus]|uniref:major facilitator superfamily domain-containing protein n=1 Tax=Aspergillus undulatus TaxID=1810928 RepID=UPI003CCD720E